MNPTIRRHTASAAGMALTFLVWTFAAILATPLAARAGLVDGPAHGIDVILPESALQYDLLFGGSKTALVWIDGDGDTDLDLLVYDEHGDLVASDEDVDDSCYVSFYVPYTQNYHIVLKNFGAIWNQFRLRTN